MAEADASEYLGFEEIWSVAPAFKIVNFNSLGNIGPLGAVVSNAGSAFRVRRSRESRSPPSRVWAHVLMCFNRNMSIDQIRSDDAVLSMDFSIVASRISLMSSLSSSLTYSATFFSRRASVLAAAARAKVATASRVKVATARVKAAAVRATERAKAAAVRAAARRKAPRARGDVAAAMAKTGATRGTVVRR